MTRNIRLILEYDGEPFHGFQRQRSGVRTVQEDLEKVLTLLMKEDIRLISGGRTDRGVHALGQTVNFHTRSGMPGPVLRRALNAHLRPSIAVRSADEVPDDFHARFSARGRVYQYVMRRAATPSVLDGRRVAAVRRDLDVEAMRRAAALFVGTHDFKAFSSGESARENTVRTVRRLQLAAGAGRAGDNYLTAFLDEPDVITLEIEADAFLRGMVRMITGTLLEAGIGRGPDIRSLLATGSCGAGGPLAPPCGLCLVRIIY